MLQPEDAKKRRREEEEDEGCKGKRGVKCKQLAERERERERETDRQTHTQRECSLRKIRTYAVGLCPGVFELP